MAEISEVRIRFVPDARDGLIGYASVRYHDVLLNDIAVRRDESGQLFLTFPRKLSATGRPHPLHHPLDRATAAKFEAAILGRLREVLAGTGSAGSP
jgi:DNA-binding cell septation regulator SpoVG